MGPRSIAALAGALTFLAGAAALASAYPPPLAPAQKAAPARPAPAAVRPIAPPKTALACLPQPSACPPPAPPHRVRRRGHCPVVTARRHTVPHQRLARRDDFAGARETGAIYGAELRGHGFAPPPFPAADAFERPPRLAMGCAPCRGAPPPPPGWNPPPHWEGPPVAWREGFEMRRFAWRGRFDDPPPPEPRWLENVGGGYEVAHFAGRDRNGYLTWAGKPEP